MPDGDILRATIEGKFDGEPVIVGLGFVSGAGAPDFQTDAQGLADALQATLNFSSVPSPFMGPLSVAYALAGIRVQDLSPGVAAGVLFSFGAVGGNVTDDGLPPNDALCKTWRTGLKGKQNRGRTYLTGFAEDSQTNGYWIPEIQTWAAEAFAQPLMDAFGPTSAAGYSLSLVHTMSGGTRLAPPTATPIISYTVHNEVRSLRRRGINVRISRHRAP